MPKKELVLSSEQINQRIQELGAAITRDCADCDLIAVGILKGAFVFMADLIRSINLPMQIDFIRAASYGIKTASSGKINITKDIELDIASKDILIIEDIVDTGQTLSGIKDFFYARNPNSVRICALIDKKERRKTGISVDYVGFEIEHGFLVGYGLDYSERYRNIADIYRLKEARPNSSPATRTD